jgi:hypothetical protein
MPAAHQLLIAGIVASVVVVLALHFLGFGEHAAIAAGVSGAVSASVAVGQLQSAAKREESPV